MSLLKEINKVPFPVAMPNHAVLKIDLPDEPMLREGWDALRESNPRYSFSGDRETWLKEIYEKKDGQDKEIDQRAEDIVRFCKEHGFTSIFSVGVGAAGLEYRIATLNPELKVTVSDYPEDTCRKLSQVFHEGTVVRFDAMNDWHLVDPNSLVLIYRMDREFTPKEWRTIFHNMNVAGVHNALFVLQYTFSLLWYVQERQRSLKAFINGHKTQMSGYIYNVPFLRTLWRGNYTDTPVRIGSWQGFFLQEM